MTRKIYKSAMGKSIDLGSLVLQNEHVRAVGNMNVNARGDVLDSTNRVIDQKNRQIQRQYQRTTNVSNSTPVQTSTRVAKSTEANKKNLDSIKEVTDALENESLASLEPVVAPTPLPENTDVPAGEGGLAAAIARSRLIKQEKEKTLREKQQAQGPRKI